MTDEQNLLANLNVRIFPPSPGEPLPLPSPKLRPFNETRTVYLSR